MVARPSRTSAALVQYAVVQQSGERASIVGHASLCDTNGTSAFLAAEPQQRCKVFFGFETHWLIQSLGIRWCWGSPLSQVPSVSILLQSTRSKAAKHGWVSRYGCMWLAIPGLALLA